jgi:tyrosyl-tRNA synthetase
MEAKKRLAREIVDQYHGREAAAAAAEHFERVHQERRLPRKMPVLPVAEEIEIPHLLVVAGLCRSTSQGRRLVEQGGVRLDGRRVQSVDEVVAPGEAVLQVGKRRFVRLVPAAKRSEVG